MHCRKLFTVIKKWRGLNNMHRNTDQQRQRQCTIPPMKRDRKTSAAGSWRRTAAAATLKYRSAITPRNSVSSVTTVVETWCHQNVVWCKSRCECCSECRETAGGQTPRIVAFLEERHAACLPAEWGPCVRIARAKSVGPPRPVATLFLAARRSTELGLK